MRGNVEESAAQIIGREPVVVVPGGGWHGDHHSPVAGSDLVGDVIK
jgi:hypothetical protein